MPLYQAERLSVQEQADFGARLQSPPSEAGWRLLASAKLGALWLHQPIGSEHLIFGAANTAETEPIFERFGTNPRQIKDAIEFMVGRGDRIFLNPARVLTPSGTNSLSLGVERGRRLGLQHLEPELIVLGVIDEGRSDEAEGLAIGVLESLRVKIPKLEAAMVTSLRQRVLDR